MDENVLAAMARWPAVPDVYGWLSLSERGQWRLHPNGDALSGHNQPGESITSPQILQFINRNYAGDDLGRWFFQNGPQRVFVRLDGAPYILHTTSAAPCLQTHNGLSVNNIHGWYLDDAGKLYAQTEHGPGQIDGRDLMAVLDVLYTDQNENLITLLERDPAPHKTFIRTNVNKISSSRSAPQANLVLLKCCNAAKIPCAMGFVRYPLQNFVTLGNPVE
ncbi:MAG TPA: DUF2946 family protein [Eoetvoesiella sp.]